MTKKIYNPLDEPEGENEIAAFWELLRRNNLFQKCLAIHRKYLGRITYDINDEGVIACKGRDLNKQETDIPFFKPNPSWAGSGYYFGKKFPDFWLALVVPKPPKTDGNPMEMEPGQFSKYEGLNYSELETEFISQLQKYFRSYRCPFLDEDSLKAEISFIDEAYFTFMPDEMVEISREWDSPSEFLKKYGNSINKQIKGRKIMLLPVNKSFQALSKKPLEKMIKEVVYSNFSFIASGTAFGTYQVWADFLRIEKAKGGPWLNPKKLPPTTITGADIVDAGIDPDNKESRKRFIKILELSKEIIVEQSPWLLVK